MLNTFHIVSLYCNKSMSLLTFLFPSWPESQSASLSYSGVRPRVENADPLFPQAELRGLKVLPPQGAWVTEATHN